jgi:L-serine dehydratase
MRESITAGLASTEKSLTGMVGWNAHGLWSSADVLTPRCSGRVQAYAMAVNEENARMRRIVAAPTAGSAAPVPGALLGVADHLGIGDEALVMPLVLAAGLGQAISRQMHISGSAGGCQAEIGSSAAMAAAAVTELLEATPGHASTPRRSPWPTASGWCATRWGVSSRFPACSRNAFFSVHAVCAAQLALARLESFIPPDEVVGAMASVGRMLPPELAGDRRGRTGHDAHRHGSRCAGRAATIPRRSAGRPRTPRPGRWPR